MNREIKFRAWDTKLLRWNLSVEISCFGDIQEYKFNGSAFHPKYHTEEDEWCDNEKGKNRFIICQFTGLLDRNDKEIYEGDVVKATDYKTGSEFLCTVDWEVNTCASGWSLSSVGWHKNEVEVIGNIYENPEFLNNE